MAGLHDHPIAARVRARTPTAPPKLTRDELKALALECGADDCGIVSLDDPSLAKERPHVHRAFPSARIAVSIVRRMHRAPIRSPLRSAANNEFHNVSHDVEDVCRALVRRLEDLGIAALNPPMAFPMEMDGFSQRG